VFVHAALEEDGASLRLGACNAGGFGGLIFNRLEGSLTEDVVSEPRFASLGVL
jgi:hypothetical protein